MIKTLIVEDEAFVALDLQGILTRLGHEVIDIAVSAEAALKIVENNPVDLILADVSLVGELNGIEMVQKIRRNYDMPVIYITAYSDDATIEPMKQTEPFEYLLKPFNEQVLRVTIELALHKTAVRKEQIASAQLLATTLQSIGDAVITTDQFGNIWFINSIAETLTGWFVEEAKGQPLEKVFHIINEQTRKPAFDPVKAVLETGKNSELANHTLLISKDGTEYHIEDSAAPIMDDDETIHGVVLVFRDVTQRRQSEMWLRQAQKLDSLGLMAGGIAHDFNNILGTIIINASMLRRNELQSPQNVRVIERIQRASRQASALTAQLLTYAGGHPLNVEVLDLNEVINAALDLVSPNQPYAVVIEKELCTMPTPILSERSQIQQVLLNLILNGYDAMKESNFSGVLSLRSQRQFVAQPSLNRYLSKTTLAEGEYVRLDIQDTGVGIDADVLQQIFDPFFSTKPTGSGLGLAATLGIIYQCEGGIHVESRLGVGTTFTILFPCQAGSTTTLSTTTFSTSTLSTSFGHRRITMENDAYDDSKVVDFNESDPQDGDAFILIVDDQADILDALNDILTIEGYTTMLASDGTEAVDLYKIYEERIALVLMDIRMPIMNGTDALIAMYAQNPELKAILMTGHANVETLQSYQNSLANVPVLHKPFSYDQVIEQIQTVLDPIILDQKSSVPHLQK